MRLIDPLDDETVQLLKIGSFTTATSASPPVWQWVRAEAAQAGLDADELVDRLPTWQHGYLRIASD